MSCLWGSDASASNQILLKDLRQAVMAAVERHGPTHVVKRSHVGYNALRRFLMGNPVRPHNLVLLWRWAALHAGDEALRSAAEREVARLVPRLPPISTKRWRVV